MTACSSRWTRRRSSSDDPANLFVAGFIGSPAMNLVEATVAGDELRYGSHRLPLPPDGKLDAHKGRSVILGIRPSDFEDTEVWRDERLPVMEVVADVVEDLGSEAHVLFTVDAPPVLVEGVAEDPEAGTPIPLVAAEGRSVFTAAVDARSAARPGRGVRLSVHPDRLPLLRPRDRRGDPGRATASGQHGTRSPRRPPGRPMALLAVDADRDG